MLHCDIHDSRQVLAKKVGENCGYFCSSPPDFVPVERCFGVLRPGRANWEAHETGDEESPQPAQRRRCLERPDGSPMTKAEGDSGKCVEGGGGGGGERGRRLPREKRCPPCVTRVTTEPIQIPLPWFAGDPAQFVAEGGTLCLVHVARRCCIFLWALCSLALLLVEAVYPGPALESPLWHRACIPPGWQSRCLFGGLGKEVQQSAGQRSLANGMEGM
jgi:hypothetical protein